MSRIKTLLVSLVATAAALAGCAEDNGGTPNTNFGNDTGGTPATTTPAPTGATPGPGATTGAGRCTSTTETGRSAAQPVWLLNTTKGDIRVTLFCDKAPITAQNFVNLTEKGYFDGTKFHRVIKDFMNQGGDPKSKDDALKAQWGTGGPGYTIVDEFYCANGNVSYSMPAQCPGGLGLKHDKPGVLSMANTGRAGSGGSQFFLTAVPTAWLDGKHAVFGQTADAASLDVVLAINKEPTDSGNRPNTPIVINKATIVWG